MTDTSKKPREFNIGVISEWPFQITILQSDFDYDNNPEALKTMGCVRNIRAIEMKAYQSLQAEIEYLKRMLADERSGDSDKDKTIRRLKSNNQSLKEQVDNMRDTVTEVNNKCAVQLDNIYEKYQSLLEQCEKLEKVLEFYGNPNNYSNWDDSNSEMIIRAILFYDLEEKNDSYKVAGKVARQALEEYRKFKGEK